MDQGTHLDSSVIRMNSAISTTGDSVNMDVGSELMPGNNDHDETTESNSALGEVRYEDDTTSGRRNILVAFLMPFCSQGITNIQRSWKVLAIAQLLSLLLAMSGATNATLAFDCHLSAPTTQAGLVYFFLSFHLCFIPRQLNPYESAIFTDTDAQIDVVDDVQEENMEVQSSQTRYRHQYLLFNRIPLKGSVRLYFLMAFLDVEANYFTYLAFRYTTLTSVSLLDALAIPSAMFFSRCILERVYQTPHFIGAIICIVGIVVNILGDYHSKVKLSSQNNDGDDGIDPDGDEAFPHPIRGDALATIGALLYGLNDVLTERMVKDIGVKEYLGVIGLFGSAICFVQAIITERDSISAFLTVGDDSSTETNTCHAREAWFLLVSSALLTVLSYIGMSHFLRKSEAALLNLSLLTGDLWSALFVVFAEHIIPSLPFWISLVLIVTGVFVYELSPQSIPSNDS